MKCFYFQPIKEYLIVKQLHTNARPIGPDDIGFTEDYVKSPIHDIPPSSSVGSNVISPILPCKCSDERNSPIYLNWRQSPNNGKVPVGFKRSTVKPTPKKKKTLGLLLKNTDQTAKRHKYATALIA